MTLAERIKAAQAALTVKKDALVTATKALEDTPDDEGALATVDELSGEIETQNKTLDSLLRAEKALMDRAVNAPAIVTSTGNKKDAVDLWAKEAVVSFIAHVERKNPAQVLAERYAKNAALEAVLVSKSAVPLATTFTPGWAAELVQDSVQGFIDLLTPTSVAAALAAKGLQLNFDGFNSVTIPRRNPRGARGDNMSGAFVGEGGSIPVGRMSVGAETLYQYKMGVISTFSKELARRSTPSIEAVIRKAILDDTSVDLDAVFLSALPAAAGIRPAGIGFGVVPIAGTAGGGIDAVIADLKAAGAALAGAGLGTRPVLIINAIDAMSIGFMQNALGELPFAGVVESGNLLGFELITSLNVPQGTAIVVDAETIATAFDPSTFDVSDVATVVEVNADAVAPTMATAAGNPNVGAVGIAGDVPQNGGIFAGGSVGAAAVGATSRSLWQTHSIGVKSITPATWGLVQPGGVVYITGITW
jgi:HK97 family phage major capsid protein